MLWYVLNVKRTRAARAIAQEKRTDYSWLLIFAAVFVAYLPALNGSLLWDDLAHITLPHLRSFGGFWRIWTELGATQQYYPLLHSAFWLEYRLWGDSMLGYHLANIVLHATAATLVVLNLRQLAVPGALLAGLIFALHPVGVESVAWISEQKNTLSAVFYLASAYVYLGFAKTGLKPCATAAPVAQPFKAVCVLARIRALRLRTSHQDRDGDAAGGVAARVVVATRHRVAPRCGSARAMAGRRCRCRCSDGLVRASDHRCERRGFRVDDGRASSSRGACHLVLSREARVARESQLHLSTLDDRRIRMVAVSLSSRRRRARN